jgi:uncharacterized membrane protein YphA (DoxX/SURF4 family)
VNSKIPRTLLGIVFLTSGLNGFFNFLPDQIYSIRGSAFIEAFKDMGYFWSFLKLAEVTAGTLLIFNVMGQFGVLMLAPICLGILFFHTFYSPQGSLFGWIAIALELTMLFIWRDHFKRLFWADNTHKELKDLDWNDEDTPEKPKSERLRGAGIRTVQEKEKKEKDIDHLQEQEMISERPTPSTLDQNI